MRVLLLVETTVQWLFGVWCELIPNGEQVDDRMYSVGSREPLETFGLGMTCLSHFRKVTLEMV